MDGKELARGEVQLNPPHISYITKIMARVASCSRSLSLSEELLDDFIFGSRISLPIAWVTIGQELLFSRIDPPSRTACPEKVDDDEPEFLEEPDRLCIVRAHDEPDPRLGNIATSPSQHPCSSVR
jgi:hypothetical protein